MPPHNCGTHEALPGAGVAASRTCLRHSHCPPFPSLAGGRARHGRDGMGSSCLRAAAPLQWCSPPAVVQPHLCHRGQAGEDRDLSRDC